MQVKNIDFSSPNSKKNKIDNSIATGSLSASSSTPSTKQSAIPPDTSELQSFFSLLSQSDNNQAIPSVVQKFCDRYIPKTRNGNFPSPLHSLYESKYLALTYSELLLVCDSVTINIINDMAKAVREEIVKQTESKLWFKFRAGRITASRMKQACHTDPAMPSQSLIKVICYAEAYKICTQATQWGCQHETFALEQYTS